MKKMLCLILTAFMLTGCMPSGQNSPPSASTDSGSGSAEETAANLPPRCVAEEIDFTAVDYESPIFLDPNFYFEGTLDMSERTDKGTYMRVRVFDAPFDSLSVLNTYAELLCQKFDFEPVCEPYYYDNERNGDGERITFSYVLRYNGDAHPSDTPILCEYTKQSGDLVISGFSRGPEWDMTFRIFYSKWLIPVDDGSRYGAGDSGAAFYGESFGTGLYLFSDGHYETTDGRLSASPGEAMFLVNGKATTYRAYMEWVSKRNQKRICVQDKFGVDQMAFALPLAWSVSSGDTYNAGIMDSNTSGTSQTIPTTYEPLFALLHDNAYISARGGLSDGMTKFNARMMYWDEEAEIAVLYFYAAFSSAPYEIEGLTVVNMLGSGDAVNTGNTDYTMRVGEKLTISGPSEFKTGHELWTWSYLNGSEYSELHDTVSQTCTLIARKPGVVRLQVHYSYSVKEPDILTGIEVTVQKEETKEYTVLITE